MADKKVYVSVSTSFKLFGEAARDAVDALKKFTKAFKPMEVPMEKVLYMNAYSGKRRWAWRKKEQ